MEGKEARMEYVRTRDGRQVDGDGGSLGGACRRANGIGMENDRSRDGECRAQGWKAHGAEKGGKETG